MVKIAIVVSHPIQHFCPQYVSFSRHAGIEVKVFFASTLGYKKYLDRNFGTEISWGNLKLDEFTHSFLNGDQLIPSNADIDAPSLDIELANFDPAVVVIYGYFQKLQRRAHKWARVNRRKLAYISDSELKQRRHPIKRWFKFPFIYWYFSAVDFFLSVGDSNEEFYAQHGVPHSRMLRMHFPIDVAQYDECFSIREVLRRRVRDRYEIDDARPVIVVVGKLVQWKRQDHIIDALRHLEEQGFFADLFIAGAGPMESMWREKAAALRHSRVYFTGFISVQELPSYYAAADVYVHSAEIEPHSIAISEAIFMGLPIIVSDRCGSYGPTDDVQENQNGLVYPFGNVQALGQMIKLLVGDTDLRNRFASTSREIALRNQRQAHGGIIDQMVKGLQVD